MFRPAIRSCTLVALVLVLTAACGTGRPAGDVGVRTGAESSRLTQEELSQIQISNLYDAVDRLRPRWLQVRSLASLNAGASQIVVFLNTKYLGGPEVLREFQPNSVIELRYLDGPRASATLQGYPDGVHVAGGIVLVTSPAGR